MPLQLTLQQDDLDRLMTGTHWNPHAVLGPHVLTIDGRPCLAIRAWLPDVKDVEVITDSSHLPMTRIHEAGLFEALLSAMARVPSYQLRVQHDDGTVMDVHDPYAFPPLLTDFDLHLFTEGTLYKAYESFGAHIRIVEGITGVHFVVWAPNASRVSVVGDFNGWNGLRHPMTSRGPTGLWELFIPDLLEGTL
jgi:1,4-alpha-glucan branching enzyme